MKQPAILLIGAGGHALACIDVIEQSACYQIAGLTGIAEEIGKEVAGHKVLGTEADLTRFFDTIKNALVTVGQIKSPTLRISLFEKLRSIGFQLPVIRSPGAYVSPHAKIGTGSIIMHGATINAGASI